MALYKCPHCKAELPHGAFPKDKSKKRGFGYICKKCIAAEARQAYRSGRKKKGKPGHFLKSLYGITNIEYQNLWDKQGGVCAVCGKPETKIFRRGDNSQIKRLAVDHNHKDGIVRGLLCSACNMGLGFFADSEELLSHAIQYLRSQTVKIDVTQVLKTLDGTPMKDRDGEGNIIDATLRLLLCNVLMQPNPADKDVMVKLHKDELARKVFKEDQPELAAEDVALLKKEVGEKPLSPLVIGQVFRMLEGKEA